MLERLKYIINILIATLLLATVVIMRDGRIGGTDVATLFQEKDTTEQPVEQTLDDGTRVINSSSLGKDIIGFGGRTPLKLYVKDDKIQKIEVKPNSETPSFVDEVIKSGLYEKWNGKTLSEAASMDVDGVTGATYTSFAVIENVRRAAGYGANLEAETASFLSKLAIKDIIGLLVILLGVFITLKKTKNKWLVSLQLVLNILVLGFWCGSFLSLSTLTAWLGNGINFSLSIVTFALICVVIIMPFFGKKGSYCHLHCPMGSAQELLGRVPIKKIKTGTRLNKFLNNLRYYILSILLFIMWLGFGFDLMNYEVFSAFIFTSASNVVLIMAALFLILSLFIHKPYCRFICPTGALITISQKTK